MKHIVKKDSFKKSTNEIFESTLVKMVEGLTGIGSSKKEEIILSVGHIFQRMRSGQFLSSMIKEWDNFREKGKIKDDYQYTEQHYSCLSEILEYLDKDIPDKEKFEALKKIFLVASTEKIGK